MPQCKGRWGRGERRRGDWMRLETPAHEKAGHYDGREDREHDEGNVPTTSEPDRKSRRGEADGGEDQVAWSLESLGVGVGGLRVGGAGDGEVGMRGGDGKEWERKYWEEGRAKANVSGMHTGMRSGRGVWLVGVRVGRIRVRGQGWVQVGRLEDQLNRLCHLGSEPLRA